MGMGCVDLEPLESVTTANETCAVGSRAPPERVMSGFVGTEYMNVGVDEVDLDEPDVVDVAGDRVELKDAEGGGENKYGGVVYVGVGRTKFGSVVANVADSADNE
ncbi:hypothetical protein FRC06_000209 [Ceratobasidium sp. 370]|nr:hypothetical protein FRC06_000209 [Ceratobasidium sp. 370]